jgi:hypothetical protein
MHQACAAILLTKNVFGMALLHPRAALFQNFRVEQLCSRVFMMFDKIGVSNSRKWIFEGGGDIITLGLINSVLLKIMKLV